MTLEIKSSTGDVTIYDVDAVEGKITTDQKGTLLSIQRGGKGLMLRLPAICKGRNRDEQAL